MPYTKTILFVIPNMDNTEIDKHVAIRTMPYGVLSIASYLEDKLAFVRTEILDLGLFTSIQEQHEKLALKIIEVQPDIIGFSAMFNSSFDAIPALCSLAHKTLRSAYLCVGGVFATNLPKDVFDMTDLIDAICHGEGEIPFYDLLNENNFQKTFKEHPSWLTKEDFLQGKKAQSVYINNLDDIPLLKFYKIETDKYTARVGTDRTHVLHAFPIHTTRGCPFNCIFCSAAANHGKKIRKMSAKRVLEDVKILIEKYGMKKLSIDDDQFLFDKQRAIDILIGLADYSIQIEIASGVGVRFMNENIAHLLKKAGMEIATIAIESGSQRMLKDIIDKPLRIEEIAPSVQALKKAGILIHAPFLFGIPGETEEDRQMSRSLMLSLGLDWVYIFIAMPLKGSRLYDVCIDKGYLKDDRVAELNLNPYQCYIKTPDIDPDYITEFAYKLNLEVNFVKNHNYLQGNYELALSYFKKLAIRYPFHAFAQYFTACCLKKLKHEDQAQEFLTAYYNCIKQDEEWNKYAHYFNLPL